MRTLRMLLGGVLAALSLVVLTPAPSYACSCALANVQAYVDWADVVATGTLVDTAPPPEQAVMSSVDPMTYLFDVDRVLAGSAGSTMDVQSAVSGASCGLEGLRVGERYVVFAAYRTIEGRPSDRLWANLCGGTGPATPDFVADVQAVTGPGAPPGPEDTGPADASDIVLTSDGQEPRGAVDAGAVALGAALATGALLTLLVGGLWLRWRSMP